MAGRRLEIASVSSYDWVGDIVYVTVVIDNECAGWLLDCDESEESFVWDDLIFVCNGGSLSYDGVVVYDNAVDCLGLVDV